MRKLSICLLLLLSSLVAPADELRGAWIASVANIDWPSKAAVGQPELQKKELITLLDSLAALRMNMVVFQVRPTADALYRSKLEPWSHWLTGKQGSPCSYDPLQLLCQEAHRRHISVHVWLNPYRVTGGGMTLKDLTSDHLYYKHPEWFVCYGKQYYFNPGLDEVREHLLSVVSDILCRYSIDAIHFDDYFYPYKVANETFPDAATFRDHPRGFTNIDDWRRNNTNLIIREIHELIQQIRPDVEFGISPFGVWRNASTDPENGSKTQAGIQNYDDLYADILLWLREGWIDYVAPQLYWEIGKKVADYEVLAHWWAEHSYGRKLYIGQAVYRLPAQPGNKQKGTNHQWEVPNEICRQIRINRTIPEISGQIFYPIHSLLENPMGIQDSLRSELYR